MSVILLAILAAAFILDNRNEVEIPNSAVTKENYLVEVDGRFFEVSHITADERYSKLAFMSFPIKMIMISGGRIFLSAGRCFRSFIITKRLMRMRMNGITLYMLIRQMACRH